METGVKSRLIYMEILNNRLVLRSTVSARAIEQANEQAVESMLDAGIY